MPSANALNALACFSILSVFKDFAIDPIASAKSLKGPVTFLTPLSNFLPRIARRATIPPIIRSGIAAPKSRPFTVSNIVFPTFVTVSIKLDIKPVMPFMIP